MTHSFGRAELLRLGEFGKICGKTVKRVLFGLNFSRQPTTGLGAIKQRHPEKAGTIMRTFSKYHGHRWFSL